MKPTPSIKEIVTELSIAFQLCRYQEINLLSAAKAVQEIAGTGNIQHITPAHLIKLCYQWIEDGMCADTLTRKFRNVKRIFKFAQEMGYIRKNPCFLVRMPKARSKQIISLTAQEVAAIENYTAVVKRLQVVKDFFLFQCYTGMSYVDATQFNANKIQTYKGKQFIVLQRKKSGTESIIPVTPQLIRLLERNNYTIRYYSNQKTNQNLKELATVTGIRKTLTTHVARKTFGQFYLENGVPIESVSRMLGHSSTLVTQRHYTITNINRVFRDVEHLAA